MPKSLLCLAALLIAVMPVAAQEAVPVAELDLPSDVADAVVDFFNDVDNTRVVGPHRIAAGDTLRGDVAVLEGPLELAGHVGGSVVVVNGDALLLPGSSISGDLWVIGGRVAGAADARIGGELVTYAGRLRYRHREGRLERADVSSPEEVPAWGKADLLLATGKSYNRVEGLPVTFGPRIETAGSNPLRIHALAIYRSVAGLRIDPEEMGYYLRGEQFLGGRRELRIGLTAHSLIDPVEDWHLSDLESGLSTFLFHRDSRDHFERRGVSVFGNWTPELSPLSLGVEVRWDRHRSVASASPWSLLDNAEPWRPQPLVGEGRLSSAVATLDVDTRNEPGNPTHGWLVRGRLEQSLTTDLVRPQSYYATIPSGLAVDVLPAREYGHFSSAALDLRRYNRLSPEARFNFRLFVAGPVAGGALPPQFQHALGGEGSLPGYPLFGRDCSARADQVYRTPAEATDPVATPFYPRYGCDAVALFQADVRGKLSFRLRWDSAPWRDDRDEADEEFGFGWDFAPDWTVFMDAGRGWRSDAGQDEPLGVNVGAGVVVSRLGFFVALPLSGDGGLNAFVRLGPRF